MPRASCAVCHKTWAAERIPMFTAPKDPYRLNRWSESVGVTLKKHSKLCALHFTQKDFYERDEFSVRRRLNPSALPKTVEVIKSWGTPLDAFKRNQFAQTGRHLNDQITAESPKQNHMLLAERSHSSVDTMKMDTFGIFVPQQKGYIAAVDKILAAKDPLDMDKCRPLDRVDPIEPELCMDIEIIKRENFGDVSSEDEQTIAELSDKNKNYSVVPTRIHSTIPERPEFTTGQGLSLQQNFPKRCVLLQPRQQQQQVFSVNGESSDSEFQENFQVYAKGKWGAVGNREMPQGDGYLSDNTSRTEESLDASDNEIVKDAILEHLAATYPIERLSTFLPKNYKVVEWRKENSMVEDIITPDEPGTCEVEDRSFVATTSTSKLPNKPSTVASRTTAPTSTADKNSTDCFLMKQQRPREIVLTNQISLAESWQQVIETMKNGSQTSGSTSVTIKSAHKENDKPETINYDRKKVDGTGATNANTTRTAVAVRTKPHQPKQAIGFATTNQLSKPTRSANTTTDNYCSVVLSSATVHKVNTLNCILNCVNFKKLYAFPSAETEPQRRHFWFLELGLELKPNWHKYLYICDNHFERSMLIENTLHKYAYPCKGLKHQKKVNIRNVGTQTNRYVAELHNYKKLLIEFTKLEELDSQQTREMNCVKDLIRHKQRTARQRDDN